MDDPTRPGDGTDDVGAPGDGVEFDDRDAAALGPLLADPAIWVDAPDRVEDAVVAMIATEAAITAGTPGGTSAGDVGVAEVAEPGGAAVIDLAARRRRRSIVLTVAAAFVIVAGVAALFVVDRDDDEADVALALEGTELAPDASAVADIDTTPLGTRILLDVRDLPPAEPGTYYEAWLRVDADRGVSAGTFHLRGGDGEIELWAGVTIDQYPLVTVTLQDEGGGPASSGRVVLRGRADP